MTLSCLGACVVALPFLYCLLGIFLCMEKGKKKSACVAENESAPLFFLSDDNALGRVVNEFKIN